MQNLRILLVRNTQKLIIQLFSLIIQFFIHIFKFINDLTIKFLKVNYHLIIYLFICCLNILLKFKHLNCEFHIIIFIPIKSKFIIITQVINSLINKLKPN